MSDPVLPWGPGAATGIGSLPGEDPLEAVRVVLDELPDLPHLPELPGRGPGADMLGRSAALLAELHVDLQPSGWRLVPRPGADEARAAAWLRADLDALELAALGWTGPLKVQVAGPWTLAAGLERPRGDRLLADAGARRDVAEALAEGVGEHVADVARRVPGASVVVQVDEPALPAVLAGAVPTASGFSRHRSVDAAQARAGLATVLAAVRRAGAFPVVHCCAADPPVGLAREAGAGAVSVDLGLVRMAALDDWAEAVDAGVGVWLGAVPTTAPAAALADAAVADRIGRFWGHLGYGAGLAAARTVVTPGCGLAGADPAWARQAYALVRGAGRALADRAG